MFGSVLRQFRENLNMTRDAFASRLGVSSSAIKSYENGDRRPDFDAILKFETEFKISIHDLLYGEPQKKDFDAALYEIGHLYQQAPQHIRDIVDFALHLSIDDKKRARRLEQASSVLFTERDGDSLYSQKRIPVVGRAAAGEPIEMIETADDMLALDADIIDKGDFAVIAAGDSMVDAGISDGDRVVIRAQEDIENGEIALVAIEDGSTIKRFYMDDASYRLEPENPKYSAQIYPSSCDIRVLGKAIAVVSSDKVIYF